MDIGDVHASSRSNCCEIYYFTEKRTYLIVHFFSFCSS